MSKKVLYTFHPQKGISRIGCCEDEPFKVVNTNYGPVVHITVDDFRYSCQEARTAFYKFIRNEFVAFCPSGFKGHRATPIMIGVLNANGEAILALGVKLIDRHEVYVFTNGCDGRSSKFVKSKYEYSFCENDAHYDTMNSVCSIWKALPEELTTREVKVRLKECKKLYEAKLIFNSLYGTGPSNIIQNSNRRIHSSDAMDAMRYAYVAYDNLTVCETAFRNGLVGGDYEKHKPKRIIQNGPATIVFWVDGTKTVVKREKNTPNDLEAAFSAALAKKMYGTNSRIKRILKNVTDKE